MRILQILNFINSLWPRDHYQEGSFEENLRHSVQEAQKYLEKDPKVLACDVTYAGLHDLIQET